MSVAEVLDLRRSGFGYKNIAKQLNMDHQKVAYLCRQNGMGGSITGRGEKLDEKKVADYVSRSGFDYVGGYTMAKKPVTVRCWECGKTFDRLFHVFRDVVNGTWGCGNECPFCRKDRQRERQQERKQELKREREHEARIKAEQRAMRKAELISRQTEERLAIHVCKNCGTEYSIGITGYNSTKYCSEKCMKRFAMRVKNDRRIRKMRTREHDTDITLEKLFGRDAGVCYLCGRTCEWTDGTDRDGTFIAGDTYPSIDHVIPLAKGGTHTWGNVRLACRKCNWEKRDSV